MDFKAYDATSMEAARPILQDLTERTDEQGTPAIVRGRHPEYGWVIFVKEANQAVLITQHPFAEFIDSA